MHLAALASLKGDVVELNQRLLQTERERDALEKRLAKAQLSASAIKICIGQSRKIIRKSHSVIVLTLNQEEDEFSELRSDLSHSQQEVNEDDRSVDQDPDQASISLSENQSMLVTADMDNCSDLNSELQRVLTGLESVLCGRKKSTCSLSVAEVDRHIEQLTSASEHCDLAIKTVEEIEGALGRDFYPSLCEERVRWEKELAGLREENESLTAMLCSKEEDLNRTKATVSGIREERDRLRRRVRELQTRLQSIQPGAPSSPGRLTPAGRPINPSTGELSSSSNDIPVAKVSSNVAEHLAHSLQDCSNIQEIFQTLYSHGSAISESKIREFEVETERLNSEQCIEAYELLLVLAESEQGLVLGQFRAAGVSAVGEQAGEESITQILKKAHDSRKTAEIAAKDLLTRLDGSCGAAFAVSGCSVQPWESLSSNSHTRKSSSFVDNSCYFLFTVHALKEEMAELKAQLYLLEKEKKALELKLSTREAQEQAYLVHIEHLKSEVEEHQEQRRRSLNSTGSSAGAKDKSGKDSGDSPAVSLCDLRSLSDSDLAAELTSALRSNLVAAYEKAKKKHQNKLKKLESQMMAMVERHETQVRMLKQRIALLEEETSRPHTSETSL
ncbi:hypothetical protein cypCar_00031888 [Cyprinus carpio]|nr:hypothetical protein cypCar_00031888 [Cyprinus carpio]